jgi:hypothetical protein
MKPLTRLEIEMLGEYNGERARGLVHRLDWHRKMAILQRRFDQEYYGGAPAGSVVSKLLGPPEETRRAIGTANRWRV